MKGRLRAITALRWSSFSPFVRRVAIFLGNSFKNARRAIALSGVQPRYV